MVMDPGKEVLHNGEILVAPHTDPGWTPLFVHAAGLVTEVGGLITHGSVVPRRWRRSGKESADVHVRVGVRGECREDGGRPTRRDQELEG